MSDVRRWPVVGVLVPEFLLVLLLALACAAQPTLPAIETALPADGAVPGWSRTGDSRVYDTETLYDFVNGAADLYFTYDFQSLAVGDYAHTGGGSVRVEVYWTATDADAYGLYTYHSFGEPVDAGVQGRLDSGYGISFWQAQNFVRVGVNPPGDDETLLAFAQAVSEALPAGGVPPKVVSALPQEGRIVGSEAFFREQIAFENFLWLGSENVLDLGPEVQGALARYAEDVGEFWGILVSYPESSRAEAALVSVEQAQIDGFVLARSKEKGLGVVIGETTESAATEWLMSALSEVE